MSTLTINPDDLDAFSRASSEERDNMRRRGTSSQLHAYNYILAAENRGFREAVDLFAKQTKSIQQTINKTENEKQEQA